MKKSELKTLVRTIVREEVALTIHEVITELKQPVVEEQPQIRQPKKKRGVREKKHFSNNSVLNDVLNETAYDDSDWKTMGDRTQTSQNMNNVLRQQYGNMMNGGNNVPLPQSDINGKPVTHVSDTLMDNLTKDYSKTIKAMEKSSNSRNGV